MAEGGLGPRRTFWSEYMEGTRGSGRCRVAVTCSRAARWLAGMGVAHLPFHGGVLLLSFRSSVEAVGISLAKQLNL